MSEVISSGITLTIPTLGETNWDQVIKTLCFQKISEHDHTGGGKGNQIGTNAISNNAVTSSKVAAGSVNAMTLRFYGGTSTGSANAQVIAPSPAVSALGTGEIFTFYPGFTNTNTATLQIGTNSPLPLRYMGQALVGGELVSGNACYAMVGFGVINILNHGGGWATWTPTGGGAYPTTVTVVSCVYQRHGNRVDFIAVTDATTTSANQAITLTLPVTASTGHVGLGTSGNNGNNIPTFGFFLSTTVMQIQRSDLVNWANGVSTRVRASGFYTV